MPTPCVTCGHPDREEIDRALVLGRESQRSLAKRYGMDRASLARHRQAHLSPALTKAAAERETAGARSALDRLEELYGRAQRILDTAEEKGQASLSLSAVRELRGITETIARVTGELNERTQVAIVLEASPEWQQFRDALLRVLADYPEVQDRVLPALAAASSGGDAA